MIPTPTSAESSLCQAAYALRALSATDKNIIPAIARRIAQKACLIIMSELILGANCATDKKRFDLPQGGYGNCQI